MQNIVTIKDRQKMRKNIQKILMLATFIIMLVGIKKTAFAATPILTIGGTSVNVSATASGTGSSGGSWSYTPAIGVKNATITLTNYKGSEIRYAYAQTNLDVVLVGTNVITNNNISRGGINYFPIGQHDLGIKGNGNLTINSVMYGINCDGDSPINEREIKLFFNANVIVHCDNGAIWTSGKCYINGGTFTAVTEDHATITNHMIINAGTVMINSQGVGVHGGSDSKFEANGGTLNVTAVGHAINAYEGSLYFNEGCHIVAKSTGMWKDALYSYKGQVHFNGGEIRAYASDASGFRSAKNTDGRFVYFGDLNPNREMAYFEGKNFNSLSRVTNLSLENSESKVGYSHKEAIAIYPKWKANVSTSQKNATLKLTNKTPNFGSGPMTTVSGMKGETISVSASCTKGKKIASLYYYKKSDPTKKTNISLTSKTFTMPEYDIVVAAKVTDIVKVSKIKLNKAKVTMRKGRNYTLRTSIKPANADDKSLTWKSSNKKVVTVSQSGVVTGKRYGTATITVTAKDGSKKKTTCKVSVGYGIDYKLNGGTNSKKNPLVYYKQTVTLKEPTRKGYVFKGWYTNKKMTKKITAISKKSKKNYVLYAKWQKVKAPSSPKISKATNIAGCKIEVTLKEMKNIDGYQISYATNAIFTENVKNTTTTKQTKTLKKLKKGTTYYIRVRAYKLDSANKKVYGSYSQVKKVEVKK